MLTPEQCSAARALLAWSQVELAEKAQVAVVTVHQLEAGSGQPRRSTLDVIRRAFEAAGIEFIDQEKAAGPVVRVSANRLLKRLTQSASGPHVPLRDAMSCKPHSIRENCINISMSLLNRRLFGKTNPNSVNDFQAAKFHVVCREFMCKPLNHLFSTAGVDPKDRALCMGLFSVFKNTPLPAENTS